MFVSRHFVFSAGVQYACDMLGCSVELLEECLTKRSVETKRDFVFKPLSEAEVGASLYTLFPFIPPPSPHHTHTHTHITVSPLCMYRVHMHVMLYARLSTVVFSHGWSAESMIESRYQCDQIS